MKSQEIDLFSGLLFCADCGSKMNIMQGVKTPERKHAYTCGKYRNRSRVGDVCTTHYIRKSVLMELVLGDMQRVMSFVKNREQEFVTAANEYSEQSARKAVERQRKELEKAEARIGELDILFRKLYEDNALGRISDAQFVSLSAGFEDEKNALLPRIVELKGIISAVTERSTDIKRFLAITRRYTEINELTYENVHDLIDRILIHDLDKETNTRKIEIFYSFVGKVDSGDSPIENVSYSRQASAQVVSLAQ